VYFVLASIMKRISPNEPVALGDLSWGKVAQWLNSSVEDAALLNRRGIQK